MEIRLNYNKSIFDQVISEKGARLTSEEEVIPTVVERVDNILKVGEYKGYFTGAKKVEETHREKRTTHTYEKIDDSTIIDLGMQFLKETSKARSSFSNTIKYLILSFCFALPEQSLLHSWAHQKIYLVTLRCLPKEHYTYKREKSGKLTLRKVIVERTNYTIKERSGSPQKPSGPQSKPQAALLTQEEPIGKDPTLEDEGLEQGSLSTSLVVGQQPTLKTIVERVRYPNKEISLEDALLINPGLLNERNPEDLYGKKIHLLFNEQYARQQTKKMVESERKTSNLRQEQKNKARVPPIKDVFTEDFTRTEGFVVAKTTNPTQIQ